MDPSPPDEELGWLTRSMSSAPSTHSLSPVLEPEVPPFTNLSCLAYLATLELACARLVTHLQRSDAFPMHLSQDFPPLGSAAQLDVTVKWVTGVRAAFTDERAIGPTLSGKLVEFVWRTRRLGGLVDDLVDALKEMGSDAAQRSDRVGDVVTV
ncbi:hypothetical protein LTR95_013833 [Oleoguttula sp. CCFEE 5521]